MSDLSLFFIMHYHDKNGEPQVVDGLGGRLTRLAVLAYAEDHGLNLHDMTMNQLIQHAREHEDPENRRRLESEHDKPAELGAAAAHQDQWNKGTHSRNFNGQADPAPLDLGNIQSDRPDVCLVQQIQPRR